MRIRTCTFCMDELPLYKLLLASSGPSGHVCGVGETKEGRERETFPTSVSSWGSSRSGLLVRSAEFRRCSEPQTSAGWRFGASVPVGDGSYKLLK